MLARRMADAGRRPTAGNTMSIDLESRRPGKLIWLPNRVGALAAMFRGATLTVDHRRNHFECELTGEIMGASTGISQPDANNCLTDCIVSNSSIL